jgi:hypothetical protein
VISIVHVVEITSRCFPGIVGVVGLFVVPVAPASHTLQLAFALWTRRNRPLLHQIHFLRQICCLWDPNPPIHFLGRLLALVALSLPFSCLGPVGAFILIAFLCTKKNICLFLLFVGSNITVTSASSKEDKCNRFV